MGLIRSKTCSRAFEQTPPILPFSATYLSNGGGVLMGVSF